MVATSCRTTVAPTLSPLSIISLRDACFPSPPPSLIYQPSHRILGWLCRRKYARGFLQYGRQPSLVSESQIARRASGQLSTIGRGRLTLEFRCIDMKLGVLAGTADMMVVVDLYEDIGVGRVSDQGFAFGACEQTRLSWEDGWLGRGLLAESMCLVIVAMLWLAIEGICSRLLPQQPPNEAVQHLSLRTLVAHAVFSRELSRRQHPECLFWIPCKEHQKRSRC